MRGERNNRVLGLVLLAVYVVEKWEEKEEEEVWFLGI